MATLPARPYIQDGESSSGWSGTDTSKASERRRALAQKPLFRYVCDQGAAGATRAEACAAFGNDGGAVSGALSVMHQAGLLARLTETRNKQKVYVASPYTLGRATERPGRNRPKVCPHCGGDL